MARLVWRKSPRQNRGGDARRTAAIISGSLILVLAGLFWVLANVANWLIVTDPLQRAEAIVVLSGAVPFRAMEAAALYSSGWAPEVWLTRVEPGQREAALRELGIEETPEEAYSREVLRRLGVPSVAIRVLSQSVRSTADEISVIGAELRQRGGQPVIVVTSKVHTRRVRVTWRALIGHRPVLIVRYPREEPFDTNRWWGNTRDGLAVMRELLGLANVWTGIPVRPPRP